jgi:hypothetical protein
MQPSGTIVIDTADPDPEVVEALFDAALIVAQGEGPIAEESFYLAILKSIGPLTLMALCNAWLDRHGRLAKTR